MRIPLRPSSGDFGVGLPPSVRQLILLYLNKDWRRSVTASTLVIFPRRPSLTSELNRLESSKRAFSVDEFLDDPGIVTVGCCVKHRGRLFPEPDHTRQPTNRADDREPCQD